MFPFMGLMVAGNVAPHTEPLTDKYYALFNNSSDAIVVFQLTDEGLPGQFTEVNDAACRMYQYTREEFLSLSPKDLDSPEGWEQAPAHVQTLEQSGRMQFEQRHIRKDGTSFPVEVHANYVTFQDQRMCIAMVRDITDRKKAEEALKESEIRYRTLFSEFNDAIMIAGTDGSIQQVNPAASTLTGYSEKELCSKKIMDLHLPEDLDIVAQQFASATTRSGGNFETRIRKADGTIIPVEIRTSMIQLKEPVLQGIVQDISNRKKAEEIIKRTLEDLNQLQEKTHSTNNLLHAVLESPESIVIFALDPQYRYLTFNENHRRIMEQIWGLAIETGVSMLDYIGDHGDREKAKQNFDRVLTGESFTLLEEYGDVAHKRRWFENKYDPIHDENGTIIGLTLFLTDVTDNKLAEEALRESEERFRTYFESSPNGITITNAQGHYIRVNSAACKKMGYSEKEFMNLSVSDIFAPSSMEAGLKAYRMLSETGQSNGEFTFVCKDSSRIILDIAAARLSPDEYIAFANDVTARKKAEQALASEKDTINTILSSLPGIFYIVDKKGKPVRWNTNIETITGYTYDEIAGMKAIDIIAKRDREHVRGVMEKTILTHYEEDESSVVTKEGTIIPFFFINTLKQVDEKSLIVGMGFDLSDRKKMEEALREVNKKLNILSNITRHDIINQVTAAEMFVDIIEMEDEFLPGSKSAEDLQMVARALKTIERQIVFTRDYQDLGINAPNWQNVGLLIDERTAILSEKLAVRNEVKNLEIYADPLFEKVVYNLFDNAIRHGKTIATLSFMSEEASGALKLICEDDGVGVPADVKEKIFNRQYFQHTGLGLFLSREILSITGMTISETGIPGKGARFEILVPEGMWRRI